MSLGVVGGGVGVGNIIQSLGRTEKHFSEALHGLEHLGRKQSLWCRLVCHRVRVLLSSVRFVLKRRCLLTLARGCANNNNKTSHKKENEMKKGRVGTNRETLRHLGSRGRDGTWGP